jgi:hypothetical protein
VSGQVCGEDLGISWCTSKRGRLIDFCVLLEYYQEGAATLNIGIGRVQGLAAWPRVHVAVYSRLEKCTFHCNEWGQFELNRGGMVGKLRISRCKLQEVKNTHGSCSAYSTVANRN